MLIFYNRTAKQSLLLVKSIIIKRILSILLSLFFSFSTYADVVKPALIEINVNQIGQIEVEARVSIEALLTGINSKYKNTQEAPNAAEYDYLRKLQSDQLKQEFLAFQENFLSNISLKGHTTKNSIGVDLTLKIEEIRIPEPGYTKVPRISLVKLTSNIDLNLAAITWYYPMSFGENAVRVRQVDDDNEQYHWSDWQWLRQNKPSTPFSLTEIVTKRSLSQVISDYTVLGFVHILPKGLDHILFILGLFLFSVTFKPLFWQITMFTLAHSITLGLSMNGIISLPANIVEPLIALSIMYIGIENVFSKSLKNSRLLIVFLFGLLHGLGFASVLTDFGLPDKDFIIALMSFNIGVEFAQLTIVLIAFLLLGFWFRNKSWYRASITVPASLLISAIGFYWFIQRLDLNF